MKKIIICAIALMCMPIVSIDSSLNTLNATEVAAPSGEGRSVVFRSTQKLKSQDGRAIYLYSSRRCELYDGDRLICECTYRIQDGEIRLLDENGGTVYKGTIYMSKDGLNCSRIVLAGTTYYKR